MPQNVRYLLIPQKEAWAANQTETELTNALEECQDTVETLQRISLILLSLALPQEEVWAANQRTAELTNALEECQNMVETLQQFSYLTPNVNQRISLM